MEFSKWMSHRHLKLNISKIEFIFSPKPHTLSDFTITVKGTTTLQISQVSDLGVIVNSSFAFIPHIQFVIKVCISAFTISLTYIFFSLLTQLPPLPMQTLIAAHLNYRNSLLIGLPSSNLSPFWSIFQWTAKMIFQKLKSDHVNPYPRQHTHTQLIKWRWGMPRGSLEVSLSCWRKTRTFDRGGK